MRWDFGIFFSFLADEKCLVKLRNTVEAIQRRRGEEERKKNKKLRAKRWERQQTNLWRPPLIVWRDGDARDAKRLSLEWVRSTFWPQTHTSHSREETETAGGDKPTTMTRKLSSQVNLGSFGQHQQILGCVKWKKKSADFYRQFLSALHLCQPRKLKSLFCVHLIQLSWLLSIKLMNERDF